MALVPGCHPFPLQQIRLSPRMDRPAESPSPSQLCDSFAAALQMARKTTETHMSESTEAASGGSSTPAQAPASSESKSSEKSGGGSNARSDKNSDNGGYESQRGVHHEKGSEKSSRRRSRSRRRGRGGRRPNQSGGNSMGNENRAEMNREPRDPWTGDSPNDLNLRDLKGLKVSDLQALAQGLEIESSSVAVSSNVSPMATPFCAHRTTAIWLARTTSTSPPRRYGALRSRPATP